MLGNNTLTFIVALIIDKWESSAKSRTGKTDDDFK